MRRLLIPLALLLVAIPAGADGATPKPKTYTVKTGDNFFSPTSRKIKAGDLVKWVWVGEDGKPGETFNEHTIIDSKGKWQSKSKTSGTFRFRFKKAGKYTVLCADHPEDMILKVRVTK